MPNRIISDKICRSEDYNSLSPFLRDLFIRLLVSADDFGRFDGRTPVIKGTAYPLVDVTEKQIGDGLSALSTAGMIDLYTVAGRPYLRFTNWDRYQQQRAKKSKFPAPDDVENCVDNVTCLQLISNDCKCPRNPIQSGIDNANCKQCTLGARAYEIDRMLKTYCAYEEPNWKTILSLARSCQECEMPLVRKAVLLSMGKNEPVKYIAALAEDWIVRGIRTVDDFLRGNGKYA